MNPEDLLGGSVFNPSGFSVGAGVGGPDVPATELADQAQPTTTQQPTNRGIPNLNRQELRTQWSQAGETRVRALTDTYGEDAFILGHLLFRVPPLAIRVKKGNIVYRWKPLRTKESIAIPSGNGECYIEVDLVFVGLQQINQSFAHLVSLWKKVPFCFIENKFIREMIIPDAPEDTMMVCLETMVSDVMEGKPDTIWTTLILKWFNYKPYSLNAWFRREWLGCSGEGSEDTSGESDPVIDPGSIQNRPDNGSIVDLSALQQPETLDIAMPPEVRLEYPGAAQDPSDPYIRPTYPVVYPWNSQPFMARVTSGIDAPKSIGNWTDGLTMGWRSFVRLPMPRSLAYQAHSETVQLVREGRSSNPLGNVQPVEGDRNIILFIGDSLTVGYTGLTSPGSLDLTQFNPRTELREDGYEFWAIARQGASLAQLAQNFERQIGDNRLKVSGGTSGSKIAAVVFMGGTNDTDGIGVQASYERIKSLASGDAGAIAVPLTPWPICGVIDSYINATKEAALISVAETITRDWSNSGDRVHVINTHNTTLSQGVDPISTEPTTFRGEMPDGVWASGEEHQRNVHPSSVGYQRLARQVHEQMPWRAMRDRATTTQRWTIDEVEDGDTIIASQSGRANITFRLNYIDCMETYFHFTDTSLDSVFTAGQDTGRPTDQQWGRIAKERTSALCGGDGGVVEIQETGTDAYGRTLAVVTANGVNVNLTLMQEGLAISNPEYRTSPSEYTEAEQTAREARRGIHGWVAEGSLEQTRRFMRPFDFRAAYPAAEGGGH